MILIPDSDWRPFDSGRQIGVAKRRFRDSGLRIPVSKLRKIDSCRHGVTHAGGGIGELCAHAADARAIQ